MLGKNLRKIRMLKGLTQSQVARELNISRSSLGNYENDIIVPSLFNLVKLAEYYNCSIDSLIGFDTIEKQLSIQILEIEKRIRNIKELLKKDIA